MSFLRPKKLVHSGFAMWLSALSAVTIIVIVCVLWLDRPVALFAYEWFGRHRAVRQLVETPSLFGPLIVLVFAALVMRWLLARRFGQIDVVANLCIITLAIADPLRGWLKYVFGRTWPAYGEPSFIFEGAYGFHPFHGGFDFGSFPSGHATAVGAIAGILWTYIPMHRAVYGGSVAAISILLLAGDFHFLSDVIAGVFVGISLSALVVNIWEHRLRSGLTHLTLTCLG